MVEVVYRLLGAPVGSEAFAEALQLKKVNTTREDAIMLEKVIPDKQTRPRIFKQCTIQKLPHLL